MVKLELKKHDTTEELKHFHDTTEECGKHFHSSGN